MNETVNLKEVIEALEKNKKKATNYSTAFGISDERWDTLEAIFKDNFFEIFLSPDTITEIIKVMLSLAIENFEDPVERMAFIFKGIQIMSEMNENAKKELEKGK